MNSSNFGNITSLQVSPSKKIQEDPTAFNKQMEMHLAQ